MPLDLDLLKYPIGKFSVPASLDRNALDLALASIDAFPKELFQVLSPLSPAQLDTPYRPGGWTVRQLAHHCADSHAQALFRFKLALTEDTPQIKPYDEGAWALLPDSRLPVELALDLIRSTHAKWSCLLHSMSTEDFDKTFFHPEKQKTQSLAEVACMYAWHGQHHIAHVQGLVDRNFAN